MKVSVFMFFDQFALLCKAENTTPTEFVRDVLHLSSSKVTAWKNGSIPKYEILNAIAEHFNVTIGTLFDGKAISETTNSGLTKEEKELISDFRNLSEQGKEYIHQQMFMAREVYKKHSVSETELKAV